MATYTWDFPTFDTAPSEDGLSDVIKTIHYRSQLDADIAGQITRAIVSKLPDNWAA